MKIVVVCPIWQRPELTKLCLGQWATWNAPGFDFRFVIVGSEGYESMSLTHDTLGVRSRYLEHPNLPLGRKFNAGINEAATLGPDYVMIMGSDMIVKDSIFQDYPWGSEFMGCLDMYIYDAMTGNAHYWPGYRGARKGQVIGPARLYSRDLLERVRWAIYPDALSRNLDGGADLKLPAPETISGREHKLLNIKTADNITPMDGYKNLEPAYTARLGYRGVDFSKIHP